MTSSSETSGDAVQFDPQEPLEPPSDGRLDSREMRNQLEGARAGEAGPDGPGPDVLGPDRLGSDGPRPGPTQRGKLGRKMGQQERRRKQRRAARADAAAAAADAAAAQAASFSYGV